MGDDLFLPQGAWAELGTNDAVPPGPHAVSLSMTPAGWSQPFIVRSRQTGQALAGHVGSRDCAEAIAAALNGGA